VAEKEVEKEVLSNWESQQKRKGVLLLPMIGGVILLMAGRGEGTIFTLLGALLVGVPLIFLLRRK